MDKGWTPSDFATVVNVHTKIIKFDNDIYVVTGCNGKDYTLTHFKKELKGGGDID